MMCVEFLCIVLFFFSENRIFHFLRNVCLYSLVGQLLVGGAAFPSLLLLGWCCVSPSSFWLVLPSLLLGVVQYVLLIQVLSLDCITLLSVSEDKIVEDAIGETETAPSKARWSSTKRRALSGPRHCVEMRPTRFFFGHIWDCVKLFFLRVQGIVWVMEGGAVVSGQIRWSFGASDVLQNMSVGTLVRLCCLCVYLDVIHQVICHTTHVPYALQV